MSRNRRVQRGDGVIFDSITQAANMSGVQRSHISKACRGIYKTTGGYTWSYVDEGLDHKLRVLRSDGKVFESLTEAAKSVSMSRQSIRNACESGDVVGEYTWILEDENLCCPGFYMTDEYRCSNCGGFLQKCEKGWMRVGL